jgi:CMP-2-keto-3-deoxyoctulosonic acid synthetase
MDMPVKALLRVSGHPEMETVARCFPRSTMESVPVVTDTETAFMVGKEGLLTERDLERGVKEIPGYIARMRVYSSD